MFINDGCSHFVTMKHDLRVIEPVIVHEMTHACLGHLPLPEHRAFWTAETIQEFWSGKSWLRTDDGNMLSDDLARILVSEFATEWESFGAFRVLAALSLHPPDTPRRAGFTDDRSRL